MTAEEQAKYDARQITQWKTRYWRAGATKVCVFIEFFCLFWVGFSQNLCFHWVFCLFWLLGPNETSFFSFSLTFSIIFFALGANGILVFSAIWINSTDTIGGISSGFFAKKGKLIAVIKINKACKAEEIIKLLFNLITFVCKVLRSMLL